MASDGSFHYSMWCFLNAPQGPLPRSWAPAKPLATARTETAQERVVSLSPPRQEKFLEHQCRFVYAYCSQNQYLADWHSPAKVSSSPPQLQESLSLPSPAVLKPVCLPRLCRKGKQSQPSSSLLHRGWEKQSGLCGAPPDCGTSHKTYRRQDLSSSLFLRQKLASSKTGIVATVTPPESKEAYEWGRREFLESQMMERGGSHPCRSLAGCA